MPQSILHSPVGTIRIDGDGTGLRVIAISPFESEATDTDDAITREAAAQIAAWFAGSRTRFTLPLAPARTPRGAVLRHALEAIRHGHTATYGEVARATGSSARAVGQACARNPFPIVVPCHRVLGAGGALGHYSAGLGSETKRRLLDHEQGRN